MLFAALPGEVNHKEVKHHKNNENGQNTTQWALPAPFVGTTTCRNRSSSRISSQRAKAPVPPHAILYKFLHLDDAL